jgi:type III secretion protein S
MTQMNVAAELQSMLWIVVYLAMPALLGAMVVGLVVGVLQAVTQVQDQSLPMAAKLLMVAAIVVLASPLLVSPLVRQSERLFDTFATLTR